MVYRGLAPGENPARGLRARVPDFGNSPESHIQGQQASQWISTTKELSIAERDYGRYGIVEIDLSKVNSETVDASGGLPGLSGEAAQWPIDDAEVLIKNYIPPGAIRVIR